MSSPGAERARAEFAARVAAPGHATDNVRAALAGLEAAIETGAISRTPALEAMLRDLAVALDAGPAEAGGGRLGGKSAEAARLIARAIERELARQA